MHSCLIRLPIVIDLLRTFKLFKHHMLLYALMSLNDRLFLNFMQLLHHFLSSVSVFEADLTPFGLHLLGGSLSVTRSFQLLLNQFFVVLQIFQLSVLIFNPHFERIFRRKLPLLIVLLQWGQLLLSLLISLFYFFQPHCFMIHNRELLIHLLLYCGEAGVGYY